MVVPPTVVLAVTQVVSHSVVDGTVVVGSRVVSVMVKLAVIKTPSGVDSLPVALENPDQVLARKVGVSVT